MLALCAKESAVKLTLGSQSRQKCNTFYVQLPVQSIAVVVE